MALENLKRWHWAGIGTLLGAALGYAWIELHPPDAGSSRSMRQEQFERHLIAMADNSLTVIRDISTPTGLPYMRHLVVYPPDAKGRVIVTGEVLNKILPVRVNAKDPDEVLPAEAHYGKFFFIAPQPYVPIYGATDAADAQPGRAKAPRPGAAGVVDFLAGVQARHPDSMPQFTYVWWYQPRIMMTGGALVGLILIGGVWPTVVRLLAGAGLAREPEQPGYDLSRFHHEPPAEKPAAPAVVSAESYWDGKEDPELNAGAVSVGKAAAAPEPAIRELNAKPLEQPAGVEAPQEDVEYSGEYYPVAHRKAAKENEG